MSKVKNDALFGMEGVLVYPFLVVDSPSSLSSLPSHAHYVTITLTPLAAAGPFTVVGQAPAPSLECGISFAPSDTATQPAMAAHPPLIPAVVPPPQLDVASGHVVLSISTA